MKKPQHREFFLKYVFPDAWNAAGKRVKGGKPLQGAGQRPAVFRLFLKEVEQF